MTENILYQSTVQEIGDQAQSLIEDGVVVIFKEGAPDELAEISVIHSPDDHEFKSIKPGDVFQVHDQSFDVTAVGDEANKNLKNLGHVTLKCNGNNETELPGDINLSENPLPDLYEGVRFSFQRIT